MGQEEQFESFYLATRQALVHQTLALTADLSAAQGAVRDAYVMAWHHWRKVSALDDPLDWVRPKAWRLAQRRHSARLWHKTKGLSEENAAILGALTKLPMVQRRTLLMTQLAGLSITTAAKELYLPQEQAEQHLQSAISSMAVALDVDSAGIRRVLLALEEVADTARLPRASIVRRAGRKRRRLHTVVAAAAATTVAVASGAFAHQPAPPPATAESAPRTSGPEPTSAPETAPAEEEADLPSTGDLLDREQIAALGRGQRWRVVSTDDNTAGNGINTICQQARFADPDGRFALVRKFKALGKSRRTAVQTVEISADETQAAKAYDTIVGWYAACQLPRYQLLKTYQVKGVGDQATILVLWHGKRPDVTYTAAVAQVGQVVTSTISKTVNGRVAPIRRVAKTLAESVAPMCAQGGDPDCAENPRLSVVPPPPSGEPRGFLSVVDLPPVGRISEPWVGTSAKRAKRNPSQTTCDQADFLGSGADRARARTFLIPSANLPPTFGLSETVGVFPTAPAAARFLEKVRGRVAACEERDLATELVAAASFGNVERGKDASVWAAETETSDSRAVEFQVGFIRVGSTVAQLTFFPSGEADMSFAEFRRLTVRAGERLNEVG